MTIDSDITRAQHAQRLLDDPLLTETFDKLIEAARMEWETTSDSATDLREMIWARLKGLKLARNALQTYIRDGKVAEDQKARQAKKPPQG